MTTAELQEAARRHIFYFEPTVLAGYREEADRFEVETDAFEGSVSIRSDFYAGLSDDQQTAQNINVKFGFRAKADGGMAIAAWGLDIQNMGDAHRMRWRALQISAAQFPPEFDARFDLWMQRYIAGNWDIEDGPIRLLPRTMEEINALTIESIGVPLFKATDTARLMFPAAENNLAYEDAHVVVYGLVNDGFDKKTIAALAQRLGVPGKFESDKTVGALRKVILDASLCAAILDPLDVVSENRRLGTHGTRPPPASFPARDRFFKELVAVVVGLGQLRDYLASKLDLNVRRCMERMVMKTSLPRIDPSRPLQANYSIIQADQMAGKTIERVEFGFREPIEGVHDSEAIIVHFTDGSILGIDTGSNAENLSDERSGLSPEEFHCRLDLCWVPPSRGANAPEQDGSP